MIRCELTIEPIVKPNSVDMDLSLYRLLKLV